MHLVKQELTFLICGGICYSVSVFPPENSSWSGFAPKKENNKLSKENQEVARFLGSDAPGSTVPSVSEKYSPEKERNT